MEKRSGGTRPRGLSDLAVDRVVAESKEEPEPECVHAPEEEKDSLSLLKAKADDLLRKLVTA